MARSCSVSLLTVAAVLSLAAPCLANVGVTSVTAGDPLGQPPAEPERVLRVGIDIQANERVTTKENDRAHLVFFDGTALTVGPSSTIVIDKYVYDPDRKAGDLALSTTKGVFRLVGGAISKTTDIKVTTPSATIGIRGGIATFEVANGGATKATFLYGDKMTVTGQGQTQIATRNGSQIEAGNGRPPTAPAVVPPNGLAPMTSFERATAPAVVDQAAATALQTQTRAAVVTQTTTASATPVLATIATTTATTPVVDRVGGAPRARYRDRPSQLGSGDRVAQRTSANLQSGLRRGLGTGLKAVAAAVDLVRAPAPGVTVLIYHRVGRRAAVEMDLEAAVFDEQMAEIGRASCRERV